MKKNTNHRIGELEALLEEKRTRIAYLEELFRVAPHKQFGESTEGLTGRSELFNEAEELVAEAESAEEAMSYNRKNPARKPLPKDFPREVIVRDITDDEKYVIVVRMNFIALVKISQRSFSLSPLR